MQITDVYPGSKEGEGDPDSLKVLRNPIATDKSLKVNQEHLPTERAFKGTGEM